MSGKALYGTFLMIHIAPGLYLAVAAVFVTALALGILNNFFRWIFHFGVVIFAYVYSVAKLYSQALYTYLHHVHGVNSFHRAIDWRFFMLLTASSFAGLIIGLIIRKAMKYRGR